MLRADSVTDVRTRVEMSRRSILGGASVLWGVSMMLSACDVFRPQWRYRYRLSATVQRGGRNYTGSSVVEIIRVKLNAQVSGTSRGEAVVVDIPGVGTLFLLLRGKGEDVDWPYAVPHLAFASRLGTRSMTDSEALDKLTRMQGVSAALSPELYPTLVSFADIQNPGSVYEVDASHVTKGFGGDARLVDISIAFTDDAVTSGIERHLPWWRQYLDKHFDGSSTIAEDMINPALSAHLSTQSFSSELHA